ncbi:MAG TPA: YbaK/EbsC family protein [Candidatus Saccharibacteria bacterium]|nr:YbaK/EbsC family protein [Candidatus Saccharibacteria bacterium]
MALKIYDWKQTELLAHPVREALKQLPETLIHGVTKNADELADTDKWAATYDIPLDTTANVVVVEWRKTKNAEREFAAVLVLADSRADLNGAIKKVLGAYKVSFAPTEKAVAATGMESGGMSPIGLPETWPLIIDERVLGIPKLYLGSGIRPSKLVVDGEVGVHITHATVVGNIARRT